MMKLLLASALTALTIAANAHALPGEGEMQRQNTIIRQASVKTNVAKPERINTLKPGSKIGIARIDKGRLIYAPARELRDWAFLDRRSAFDFAPVSPAAHIKNLPEIPMQGRDSSYQLDEIRFTAFDLGFDYVVFYAEGKDARAGSFGGKSMWETGLIVDEHTKAPGGKAKALLVNTYNGKILGTVTSDEIEFGIGDLTDKVEALLETLSDKKSHKA